MVNVCGTDDKGYREEAVRIGNREFANKGKTYIMGILNITPDSFSDGGKWNDKDRALFHVESMLKEGMDILDIGGESTRPGYRLLTNEEEAMRVIPVIEAVKSRFDVPVSLDTYKAEVARAGVIAGIDLINDIWGLCYEEEMAEVIAKSGLPCCLMQNRNKPDYHDFIQDMKSDLAHILHLAQKAGIKRDKIILDPGVGFGKTYEQNLQTIQHLDKWLEFGCPLLLGTSRKSVIGTTLDLPVTMRVEGTLATTIIGVMKGCSFVRVHDVKENARAIKMAEAILYS